MGRILEYLPEASWLARQRLECVVEGPATRSQVALFSGLGFRVSDLGFRVFSVIRECKEWILNRLLMDLCFGQ